MLAAVENAGSGTQVHIDRWASWMYLAVRLVHVAQAGLCIVSGRRAYRRPALAAAVFSMCAVETAWLVRRCVRNGSIDPMATRVDVGVSMVGLVALGAATHPEDRTTSLNWMLPYSVGTAVGLGISVDPIPEGIAEVAALAGVYIAVTATGRAQEGSSSRLVTAMANAMSYGGFYAVVAPLYNVMKRNGRDLDEARNLAQERGEKLAAEHERNRQHRIMHDSAIQTLEAVAAGLQTDPVAVQAQAGIEARRLRQALASSSLDPDSDCDLDPHTGLDSGLSALAAEFSELGLDCEITLSVPDGLDESRVEALLEATREALRNVLKHSGIRRAVVSCVESDGGVMVTIRDQGKGFSLDQVTQGFGLTQSVQGRLDDVDGRADVWSEPGRGTRVTLWAPS